METDLGTSRSTICLKCRVFAKRPLKREDLIKLKVKDLKWYLRSHRISSNMCKEKSDLVDLIIQHFVLKQNNNQQPGTSASASSRRSFDEQANSFNERRENSRDNFSTASNSQNASQSTSPIRNTTTNLNSDNSNESTLGSEWEFINERFSSINNSNNQTPTNEQEFININCRCEKR